MPTHCVRALGNKLLTRLLVSLRIGSYLLVIVDLVCDNVKREEGVKGYWKGNLPQVISIVPYSAIQLYAYETYKKLFSREDGELSVLGSLGAGACAGMTSTLKRKTDLNGLSLNRFVGIVEREGVIGLYRGFVPNALKSMPISRWPQLPPPPLLRPEWLDGSLVGDYVFDPFGLGKPAEYPQFDIDSLDQNLAKNPYGSGRPQVDSVSTVQRSVQKGNAFSGKIRSNENETKNCRWMNRVFLLKLVLGFCYFGLLTCLAHDTIIGLVVIFCGQPRLNLMNPHNFVREERFAFEIHQIMIEYTNPLRKNISEAHYGIPQGFRNAMA
ncbi:hypothetical protein HID58_007576 [Brassica napus]|uniref:Uncharacterized protein n=1 Tax=Brassica napus TaxID=3708 RepID=A0ABQ8EEN8_BRANA|nr:hypothetical protein HID58_007576 [Brassica napus]